MDNNKTRNYIIALGILLLIFIGIIFYFILRSNVKPLGKPSGGGVLPDTSGGGSQTFPPKNDDGSPTITPQPLTASEQQRLVQISKDPVIGATIKKDRLLYFKRETGHIFTSPFDASLPEERLTNFSIPNIINASWSPSRAYTLVTALNETVPRRFWIHFTSTSTIESGFFPENIISPTFSPSEEKLASIARNGSVSTVIITTPQGKTPKTVIQTSLPDLEVSWASKTILALKTRSSAFIPSILQTVSVAGGAASTILGDARGLDVLWNASSNTFITLEVTSDGKRPALVLRDRRAPEQIKELSFKTFPEKCVWSRNAPSTIYCAIPQNLGSEPIPDGWWKGKVSFNDSIWKIDTTTGNASSVLEGGNFDVIHPILSPKEEHLFFINKKDSILWSLRLIDTASSTQSH